MSNKLNLVTFLDLVGRTIIAEEADGSTEKVLKVKNPVVVHAVPQPDQTGNMRMTLQLLPLFFREFLADKNEGIIWDYKRSQIIEPANQVVFDFKLEGQYVQLFNDVTQHMPPQPQPQPQPQPRPQGDNVIPLFDE